MTTTTSESVASLYQKIKRFLKGLARAGLFSFLLAVPPVPASRPKVGKFGVYYSKTYSRFMRAAQTAASDHSGKPTEGPIVVMVETVVERPKTGKLELPKGDVDNYAKGPLDVLTKAGTFWWDDDQVAVLISAKRYARADEKPGVTVDWFPI